MSYATGAVLVVTAAVLWSLLGLAIRSVEEAGTWTLLFWRSVGMAPVLFAFIAIRSGGRPFARLRAAGWTGLAGGFGLVFAFAGAIYAIQTTTVANAVFLFAASPFIAAALGRVVLGESVRRGTWVAMAVAGLGMAVMVRGGLEAGVMAGNLAALASAFGFAAFTITLRRGRSNDMMPAVLIGAVLSMIVGLGVQTAAGSGIGAPPRDVVLAIGMGAVLLATGMVLYTLGSRVVPAAELTLLTMAEVMLAPVWVYLALGEAVAPATLAGGALLLAAIAGNALSGMRRRPVAPILP